ncbi:MAG: hypothetical protein SFV15_18580 [Polyangiaceae bacterium]|nr:hypothetical protein [Polyangiaceae bacterium]
MVSRSLSFLATLVACTVGLFSPVLAQAPEPSTSPPAPAPPEAGPRDVQLSDGARVEKAITLYQSGEYGRCADELSTLLDGEPSARLTDPLAIERGRLWLATCLIGDGQPARAETALESALRARPGMRTPDPLTFPRALVDLFIQAQDRLRFVLQKEEEKRVQAAKAQTELLEGQRAREELRVKALERFAATETVTYLNRRWIAALPFGVGQFQNGNDGLGWVLLSSEAILAGTALVSTVAYVNLETTGVNALNSRSTATDQAVLDSSVNRNLRAWYTLSTVSGYGFAAVALGGVLEAQLNFVPEVSFTRRRELPEALRRKKSAGAARELVRVWPSVALAGTDVAFGLSGSF